MMPSMPRIFLLLLALTLAVLGVNSLEQNFTCPICATEWKQRVETSARPNGLRLDLRQLGDVQDPPTLPQCPKCRFVVFSENLGEPVLEKLKPFIQGQDYQILADKSPTYACLAQIQQTLKAHPRFVAQSFLRASWQVEDKEVLALRYLNAASEQFGKALDGMDPGEKAYPDAALLRGEVLRRLGQWEEATRHFQALATRAEFKDRKRQQVIAQQLALIERKDSQPQPVREQGLVSEEPELLPDPEPISVKKPEAAAGK